MRKPVSIIQEIRRPRLPVGAADHGPARPAGPALDLADHLGAARNAADLARAAVLCDLRETFHVDRIDCRRSAAGFVGRFAASFG